jgi:hypothetical protein
MTNKPRKYAVLENAQVRVGTTMSDIVDALLLMSECAQYNAMHCEEGSPYTQATQTIIAEELMSAINRIRDRVRKAA